MGLITSMQGLPPVHVPVVAASKRGPLTAISTGGTCPHCMGCESGIGDSRGALVLGKLTTARRRRCEACRKTFRTVEVTLDDLKSLISQNEALRLVIRSIA